MSMSSSRSGRLRPLSSIQFTFACKRPSIRPAMHSTPSAETVRLWLLMRLCKTGEPHPDGNDR